MLYTSPPLHTPSHPHTLTPSHPPPPPPQVRPIASLSILPLSLAQATPNTKCHAFPLGYSAEFIAQLHDNIGRRFDYAEIPLLHRLNRFDIVRVSPETGNATYTVKAAKQGHAILKIWVSSLPHVADYVRVRVAYAIIPSLATVHLGARICFTTHLTETKPGWWSAGEGVGPECSGMFYMYRIIILWS